jgi:hypothetical protein
VADAPAAPETTPRLGLSATDRAAPSAAVPSTPSVAASPRTILTEDFADNSRGWPDDPQATAWVADGGYHLSARHPDRFVAIGAPLTESLRDVIMTATFRKVGGPPGGGYGLIVRDQGPGPRDGITQGGRYYVLEAGDRGELGIWRRDGDRWIELLPWTASAAVRPGDVANELTVQAIGPRLSFVVNGADVASLEDPTLEDGSVGIFVGGDLNEVVLERLIVQTPN